MKNQVTGTSALEADLFVAVENLHQKCKHYIYIFLFSPAFLAAVLWERMPSSFVLDMLKFTNANWGMKKDNEDLKNYLPYVKSHATGERDVFKLKKMFWYLV